MTQLVGPDGKPADWWILELPGYGITACPSQSLVYNARDIFRSQGYKIPSPRRARASNAADLLAINATINEIKEEQAAMAARMILMGD